MPKRVGRTDRPRAGRRVAGRHLGCCPVSTARSLRPAARRAFVKAARRVGVHVVPATFYSPIPDLDSVDPGLWDRPDEMPGVAFDLDRQLAYLDEVVGDLGKFTAPRGYVPDNPTFPPIDARILDSVMRATRPSRVVELGSGVSTLIISSALPKGAQHRVVDPFPSALLADCENHPQVAVISTADAPLEWFTTLGPGDVLFADTTHTVKVGGDVARLILDVLPRLAPGVVVHVHDIFRPYPYPRFFYEDFGFYWQEQELLQAHLAENPRWDILCAAYALWRLRPEPMRRRFPDARPDRAPGSFWMRRR